MEYTIDKKFLNMIIMLVHFQNQQLAKIISEEESIPYHLVSQYVPSTHKIQTMIGRHN